MLSDFAKNEIFMSSEYIKNNALLPNKGMVFNVIGEHILCDYIANVLKNLNNTTEHSFTVYQHSCSDTLSSTVSKQCFLYCFDARVEDDSKLNDLTKALSYASIIKNAEFVLLAVIPQLEKREDIETLSEMELSAVTQDSFLSKAEDTLRTYCDKLNIKEIRFDNFLIEDSDYNAFNLVKITEDILNSNCVTIKSTDALDYISTIGMADAVDAIFTVMKSGKKGNIYNCSSEPVSVYELKSYIYKTLCGYGIKLDFIETDKLESKTYRALSSGKLYSLSYSRVYDNATMLLYALSDLLPQKYDIISDSTHSLYDGKLKTIRKIELELLNEVDAICRKHNIQYFLSGGTMLGAVRHKGFIPWDDDIDIAMLRGDFNKFKQVCADELSDKYQYQSYDNSEGYHYFFDKITIKDTYFSTKYSDIFDMLKGISMDIFVFDKTSDKPFMQKLHYKALMALRLMMNTRWINYPRKDKSYTLTKLLLPVLRIFSMNTYSKMYDKLLRHYEKKKTSTTLPPATDHKWRGTMPLSWFENVTDVKFENVSTYIPTGYDNYLKQWYGDDYKELLPISKRVGSHDFYRLDLGNEIIDKTNVDTVDKHYNYKGELL